MSKDYEQFCGLAKAGSILGERWALLILRDLSVGPRRFKDLHEGLPGVPTSVLSTRLRELQEAAVIVRQVEDRPGGALLYALTPHGEQLRPILDALGRWGAHSMAAPGASDVITDSSLAAALRAGFRPGMVAAPTCYLVRAGSAAAWAIAGPERVDVGTGRPESAPDLTIHSSPHLRTLLAGRLTPDAALASGALRIEGPFEAFETFARIFHVPLQDSSGARADPAAMATGSERP